MLRGVGRVVYLVQRLIDCLVGPKVVGLVPGGESIRAERTDSPLFTIPRSVAIYGPKVGRGPYLLLGKHQQLAKSGRV